MMAVNCISAKLTSMMINFFTVAKVLALIIIIIIGVIEMGKGKRMKNKTMSDIKMINMINDAPHSDARYKHTSRLMIRLNEE